MSRRWYILRLVTEPVFTLSITMAALKWSSYIAYMDRGHSAIGGEFLFAGAAGYVAYKLIDALFEAIEEEIYARIKRRHRKKRSRGTSPRDYWR